jgi:apolipoprotein N-acyltransferase
VRQRENGETFVICTRSGFLQTRNYEDPVAAELIGGGSAKLTPMRGISWRIWAASALTAILLDLPFPIAGPLPAWRTIFAWFALVPLLVVILRLPQIHPTRSRRWTLSASFLVGWLSGALWFGTNCYWVYSTMHLYAGLNPPLAVLALVLFSLYLGFWFGAFTLALSVINQATQNKGIGWLALASVPFLWTATEFALARIPAFPWDLLGYSQVDNGLLMRLAPWTGVYGISFVLATANALLSAGILFRRRVWVIDRPPAVHAALSGKAWGAYGLVLILIACLGLKEKPPQPTTDATAMLVQPNIDVATDDVWAGAEWPRHMAEFQRLASQTCKSYLVGLPATNAPQAVTPNCIPYAAPSLVVWPESPAPFREADPRFQTSMATIVNTNRAPLIVGDIGMDEDAPNRRFLIYNSASIVAQDGRFVGRYDKIHLVPFGEYIPLKEAFFFLHKVVSDLPDMSTGKSRASFTLKSNNGASHQYGVFICYESVFGDEVRQFVQNGAEVLVNISDDGWYGDTSAPWQHLNMARMRAIENRRWLLRDTNNGVTASIDPYGTIRQSIPRHQIDSLPANYAYSSEQTFYTTHGDLLPALCAILTLVLLGWAGRILLYDSEAKPPVKPA